MGQRKNGGMARFLRESAAQAALGLFRKARVAGDLAHAALNARGRALAYAVKQRLLDAALELHPGLCLSFPDPASGRWIYYSRTAGAMHGRRIGDDGGTASA